MKLLTAANTSVLLRFQNKEGEEIGTVAKIHSGFIAEFAKAEQPTRRMVPTFHAEFTHFGPKQLVIWEAIGGNFEGSTFAITSCLGEDEAIA